MKKLFVSILLLTSLAHAGDVSLNIQNFNFSYRAPMGEGSARVFTRSGVGATSAVKVNVEKINQDFRILVSGQEDEEFVFTNAPSFLTDAETMTIRNLNMKLEDQVNLSMTQGRFNSRKDELKLDGLSLNCHRRDEHSSVMDQLISGCIQHMSLRSSKFSTSGEEAFAHILTDSLTQAIDVSSSEKSLGINSLNLNSRGGRYDLSADVKAQISGRVRSNGNLSYDAETGVLTIRISEVRFSFLNITSRVFDELKKRETPKLRVRPPFVYYSIK